MMAPTDLQGIVPFVQAVESGSFAGAARRLRVTTSAIGKAIAQMEHRLGVRLINRTTRALSLTSEGRAYYEACVNALAEIDAAQSVLASRRQAPSGRLRVDLPLAFGRRCVAPVLFELACRYPELGLEIGFTDRRVDLVGEGVDLAVRMGELDDSTGLIGRRLCTARSALVAAPAYLARHGRPASIAELAGHALINYGRDGLASPWMLMDENGEIRKFTPKARLTLGHGEPLLDAVLAGCGISWLPTWLSAEHLRIGALEPVLGGRLVDTTPVNALWPKTRDLIPRVRVVVDELVRRFASPPWDRP
jgi:DNA-binding transcriptional LysR family regulator